jgi:uncharacterized membrane protein YphA (DoxX/SURF4 family)
MDSFTKARWPLFLGLLALCSAYIQGGLNKLLDFSGAVGEAEHFGLPMPILVAASTIALALGAFTLAATFIANRFWELPPGHERFMTANGFFEHLGLVGAFLLVAWYDLRDGRTS